MEKVMTCFFLRKMCSHTYDIYGKQSLITIMPTQASKVAALPGVPSTLPPLLHSQFILSHSRPCLEPMFRDSKLTSKHRGSSKSFQRSSRDPNSSPKRQVASKICRRGGWRKWWGFYLWGGYTSTHKACNLDSNHTDKLRYSANDPNCLHLHSRLYSPFVPSRQRSLDQKWSLSLGW